MKSTLTKEQFENLPFMLKKEISATLLKKGFTYVERANINGTVIWGTEQKAEKVEENKKYYMEHKYTCLGLACLEDFKNEIDAIFSKEQQEWYAK